MCLAELKVSLLQRGTFVKQPQKYPKRPCPCVRLSLRSSSLAPVPLRGHAVTGHPWPNTALPASMPVDPLRRTSTRPPERGGRSRSKARSQADHKQVTSRSQAGHKQVTSGLEHTALMKNYKSLPYPACLCPSSPSCS